MTVCAELPATTLVAAHDLAAAVHARRDRLVRDPHAERPGRVLAVGGHRLAVQPRRDAVVDHVVARPDGGQAPLELACLAGEDGADRPRVGGGRVAALGAAVDDPDRPVGIGEPGIGGRHRERARRVAAAGHLGVDRHREVGEVAVVVVADREPHRRRLGDRLARRERRLEDLERELALRLVLVLALAAAAGQRQPRERESHPYPHGAGERTTGFRGGVQVLLTVPVCAGCRPSHNLRRRRP